MSGESLFTIACEMLSTTNEFHKSLEDINYTNSEHEDISLKSCVKAVTSQKGNKFCQRTEANLQIAYECIIFAMILYLEDYPATFSFKQQTKELFYNWVERIQKKYSIKCSDVSKELKLSNSEKDTGIAMLKILHSRKGVTYKDIEDELDIGIRSIQKSLVKISPSLYEGPKEAYSPFRLGGQPLCAKVTLVNETDSAKEKRFYTLNSVHPLVLQENIPQLATLLKALAHQYWDGEDDKTRIIGIDIWCQMSEYARNKIKDFYAFNDPDLDFFIKIICNPCPDSHACMFYSEKEMMKNLEMELSTKDALAHLMKAEGRKGIIILNSEKTIEVHQIEPIFSNDGKKYYRIVDNCGVVIKVNLDEIRNVKIY